jgi:membrane associated rhomboid family serine protease
MEEIELVVRRAPERKPIDEWSLVLAAESIDHRVDATRDGYALVVGEHSAARAERLLAGYDAENAAPRPPPPPAPEYGRTAGAVVLAAALVAFHAATGARTDDSWWFERGSASALRIVDGELWRAVTALTLHADLGHVAANAAALAVFGTALLRAVGPGVGLWLLLASGTAGNLLNAFLHGSGHIAVGASTSVFGGLGALGSLGLIRRRHANRGWRAWMPLFAALGLLAWLGSGKESDVVAHLLGFLAGVVLGAPVALLSEPPGFAAQLALSCAAALAVVACWMLAFAPPFT